MRMEGGEQSILFRVYFCRFSFEGEKKSNCGKIGVCRMSPWVVCTAGGLRIFPPTQGIFRLLKYLKNSKIILPPNFSLLIQLSIPVASDVLLLQIFKDWFSFSRSHSTKASIFLFVFTAVGKSFILKLKIGEIPAICTLFAFSGTQELKT